MKKGILYILLTVLVSVSAFSQTAAFTYQGQIISGGSPINSTTVIRFKLFDASTAGNQVGGTIDITATPVNGLFTTQLNFGTVSFPGARRWLEISIVTNGGATVTMLSPRQEITPAPYAINAQTLSLPLNQTVSSGTSLFSIHNTGSGDAMTVQGDNRNGIEASSGGSNTSGIYAHTSHPLGYAGYFSAQATTGNAFGVYAETFSTTGVAVTGEQLNASNSGVGVYGLNNSPNGYGVLGSNSSASGFAGYFSGRACVTGNLGIGTTTTNFPLSFANLTGEKISLYGSTANHYGMGIQNLLMQLFTDVSGADIAFGYGNSSSFNETMRVKGNGSVGIGISAPADKLELYDGIFRISSSTSASQFAQAGVGLPAFPSTSAGFGVRQSNGAFLTYIGGQQGTPYYGGSVLVANNAGAARVTLSVNSSDQGVVSASVKNFREPNPRAAGTDIVYACIEGPEAAAYIRGTAKLMNGKVTINFPDHFQDVAELEGMTVQLTPCSAESKGLAVIEQTTDHVVIQELFNGKGNYQFHWLIQAVRKGYKDYQVIQPSFPVLKADSGK